MPIDWDNFNNHVDTAINNAVKKTDDQLAGKIASETRMTSDEVKELFPDPADVKKLGELMKIVKSSEDRNNKITSIVSNAQNFGGVLLTLVNKFV